MSVDRDIEQKAREFESLLGAAKSSGRVLLVKKIQSLLGVSLRRAAKEQFLVAAGSSTIQMVHEPDSYLLHAALIHSVGEGMTCIYSIAGTGNVSLDSSLSSVGFRVWDGTKFYPTEAKLVAKPDYKLKVVSIADFATSLRGFLPERSVSKVLLNLKDAVSSQLSSLLPEEVSSALMKRSGVELF